MSNDLRAEPTVEDLGMGVVAQIHLEARHDMAKELLDQGLLGEEAYWCIRCLRTHWKSSGIGMVHLRRFGVTQEMWDKP